MAEHCPPVIFVEGNAPSFPRRRGACQRRQLGGNGRALPSSDLGGGKRSVVSASAWFLVCVTGSAAMAEHCPPVTGRLVVARVHRGQREVLARANCLLAFELAMAGELNLFAERVALQPVH